MIEPPRRRRVPDHCEGGPRTLERARQTVVCPERRPDDDETGFRLGRSSAVPLGERHPITVDPDDGRQHAHPDPGCTEARRHVAHALVRDRQPDP